MAVTDMIASVQSQFSDSDALWRQFVLDHKQVIANNSNPTLVDPNVLASCEYNLNRYLRTQNISTDYDFVIFMINNIASDIQFVGITTLLIPNPTFMKSLYESYQTTSQTV